MTRFVLSALLLTLSLGLAGCGGGGSSAAETPGISASVSVSPNRFEVAVNAGEMPPVQTTTLTFQNVPPAAVFLTYNFTGQVVDTLNLRAGDQTAVTVDVFLRPDLQPGSYQDGFEVEVCLDRECRQHVQGSPLRFTVSLTVAGEVSAPPSQWPSLPVLGHLELGHDVVEAAYSRSQEALVMVSSAPTNALHVYRPLTGERFELPLAEAPTALAVSPDGRTVVTGHDSSITYARLDNLVAGGIPEPRRLDVSAPVGALALSNRGRVYVVPRVGPDARLRSVGVESNTESPSGSPVRAGSRMVWAIQESALYLVPPAAVPGDLEKHLLTLDLVLEVRFAPNRGLHDTCGDVWINERGTTLYTACGNTFRASPDQALDMTYAGRLQLSFPRQHARILSLSQSDVLEELLLVETDAPRCDAPQATGEPCGSRVAVYQSESMSRIDVYQMPLLVVAEQEIPQQGMFVFHGGDGQSAYLVSRGIDADSDRFFVSVLR